MLKRGDEGRTLARDPPVSTVGHSSQNAIVLVIMMANFKPQLVQNL